MKAQSDAYQKNNPTGVELTPKEAERNKSIPLKKFIYQVLSYKL
jgi:hypothetical protein